MTINLKIQIVILYHGIKILNHVLKFIVFSMILSRFKSVLKPATFIFKT